MRARIVGLGLVCLLVLGACDQPSTPAAGDASPATPVVPPLTGPHADIRTTINPTLTAAEAKNLETALGKIAADAKVAHAIADGPLVFMHYAGARDDRSSVMLEMFQFDESGAVVAQDLVSHVGAPANIALTGAVGSGIGDAAAETANKAVVTKFYETISDSEKIAQLNDVIGDTYVEHSVAPPADPGSAGLIKTYAVAGRAAQTLTIKMIGAWGDLVAAEVTVATADGSGGWTYVPGADILRIDGGKIVERWRINY